MTAQKTTEEGRARLDFDFDDDDVQASKEETVRKIEEIGEKAGFTARAPRSSEVLKTQKIVKDDHPRRRRHKTGRTFPFSTKIKPETYDKLGSLADQATAKEGRPISFAEILERALDCLENSRK